MTYSVGIDLERVERFAGGPSDPDVRVLFTDTELTWCARGRRPAHRLAGTWCAKEAVVKALWPWARLDPRRVSVVRTDDGGASAAVSAADDATRSVTISVTISDAGPLASAFVVAYGAHLEPHDA